MSTTYRFHIDTRDGTIYNCVLMPDGKWWSAENLRWAGAGYDYGNIAKNREVYGRLYTLADRFAGLAPSGAHDPSSQELVDLFSAIGALDAGKKLKSASVLWEGYPGTDDYGFSLHPGGQRQVDGVYTNKGEAGFIWGGVTGWSPAHLDYWFAYPGNDMLSSSTSNSLAFSSRFIVDVFNEPRPPAPSIFPVSGTYQGTQLLTILATGGTVHYTTDGSDPTALSPVYASGYRIQDGTTIKAVTVSPEGLLSPVSSASYRISGNKIVSIPSYTAHVLPYLLEQYKGDNP